MGKIIFITGGVRSGKSSFAESVAVKFFDQNQKGLYYLASGVPFDEEMKSRIVRHQKDRERSKKPWYTIDVIDDLPVQRFQENDIVLWDCITTWLNNILYKTEHLKEDRLHTIYHWMHQFQQAITQWKENGVIILIVSNEVLDEVPSSFKEVQLYRKLLGTLHQWIVSICDEAYELDYGISVRRK
ncbi:MULTISPECIES: bifunctional adenosylcobinamide kinase/adenosylcobinamide-phosphate guanylyltransferase [unclassified Ureibacillus]|uniref:bifunctional adenosylcobinamide kinase/adenosylcobinamide-phosphate guanylyltransferase n=1 Tax=unclassified Ureibacillus TaxID=2638520 RepID=UPI0030D71A63